MCVCLCVCLCTHVPTHGVTEGTERETAWRLKDQVRAGRDGPGESNVAAPMGMESRGGFRESLRAEMSRLGEKLDAGSNVASWLRTWALWSSCLS